MHPDVSKSPDAHEQFVLLNEAYEYLINVDSSVGSSPQSNSTQYQWTQEDWQNQQRENAKERAREYARMRYAEFIKSDYYKEQKVVDTVTLHLGVLLSLFLLTIFPMIMISIIGIEAILGIALINLVLLPVHVQAYRNLKGLNAREFLNSIGKLFQIRSFQIVSMIVVNIILFFTVIINTLVSITFIASAYSIAVLLFLIIVRNPKFQNFMSFAVAPTLVSLLFLINFAFASYPTQEKFRIQSDGYYQQNSMITLQDHQLDEYPGIRTFSNFQEVRYAEEVVYTFEYGFLGLMVMTDYHFLY